MRCSNELDRFHAALTQDNLFSVAYTSDPPALPVQPPALPVEPAP